MPIKVIHVTHSADRYGIVTFLLSLVGQQKNEGLFVGIGFDKEGEKIDAFRAIGIPVYCAKADSAREVKLYFYFRKIFNNFDIIQLHSFSPWAFFAAKSLKKRVIYTFHGALGLRKRWMDIVVKWFHRSFLLPGIDFMTFASEASLNRFKKGLNIDLMRHKYQVFSYGMNISEIKAEIPKAEINKKFNWDKQFVIGTASRLDPYKRLELLIEAFSLLQEKNGFRLIVIGAGDDKYGRMLQRLCQQKRIVEYVDFLGYRSDAIDIMAALDYFVLPTKNEPFGLALLEAMALGVPCAVFAEGGGLVDIIGASGIIVTSAEELASSFLTVRNDHELRMRLSRQVKERAKIFDITHTSEKLLNLYKLLSN
jgi:glycosyltransferase involved in cell wall biosynthesis